MDETKLFRYPIDSVNYKKVEIIVEDLKGSTEVSAFFDISTKNETQDGYDENSRVNGLHGKNDFKRSNDLQTEKSSTTNSTIDVLENSTFLILNVYGIDDINAFKIKIKPIKLINTNSFAYTSRSLNILFYFFYNSFIYFLF